jgi:hypothetical protein
VRSEGNRIHRQTETTRLQPVHRDRIILRAFVERRVHVLGAIDAGQDRRQLACYLIELRDVRIGLTATSPRTPLIISWTASIGCVKRSDSPESGEHLTELLKESGLCQPFFLSGGFKTRNVSSD